MLFKPFNHITKWLPWYGGHRGLRGCRIAPTFLTISYWVGWSDVLVVAMLCRTDTDWMNRLELRFVVLERWIIVETGGCLRDSMECGCKITGTYERVLFYHYNLNKIRLPWSGGHRGLLGCRLASLPLSWSRWFDGLARVELRTVLELLCSCRQPLSWFGCRRPLEDHGDGICSATLFSP